ncbi:hypothetical protein BKA66DRAFT_569999 [Pyrenochaeta sp. MPI-SDFR-AT-0127]|nr:hypothetical protein BKA66DRAFT_569999 [Pyrenochaeta sp. MPI-SDFR-AT-0127]
MQNSLTFPPAGNLSYLPPDQFQSDLTIRAYLNAAAADPPTSGFGTVPTYQGDIVKVAWSASDFKGEHRSFFCIPCRQNEKLETLNWTSCQYEANFVPTLASTSFLIPNHSALEIPFTLKFPDAVTTRGMEIGLCTISIPAPTTYNLSVPFPWISQAPPANRGAHVFAVDAPVGQKTASYNGTLPKNAGAHVGQKASSGMLMKCTVGLLACAVVMGYF